MCSPERPDDIERIDDTLRKTFDSEDEDTLVRALRASEFFLCLSCHWLLRQQFATAVQMHANAFLTKDTMFNRVEEVNVRVLKDFL